MSPGILSGTNNEEVFGFTIQYQFSIGNFNSGEIKKIIILSEFYKPFRQFCALQNGNSIADLFKHFGSSFGKIIRSKIFPHILRRQGICDSNKKDTV